MTQPTTLSRTRYITETPNKARGQYCVTVDFRPYSAADGGLSVQWVPERSGYRRDGSAHDIELEYHSGDPLTLAHPVNPDALDAWLRSPEAQELWQDAETAWRYAETEEYPKYRQGDWNEGQNLNPDIIALFSALDAIAAAIVSLPDLGEGSGAWDAWDWFAGEGQTILETLTDDNLEQMAADFVQSAAADGVALDTQQVEIYLTSLLQTRR